jgi:hypothetical protein
VSRFRDPGAREAAWARWYAKKGLRAEHVVAGVRTPTENDRLAAWREKHDRLDAEFRARFHRFDFTPAREPADPDAEYRRQA